MKKNHVANGKCFPCLLIVLLPIFVYPIGTTLAYAEETSLLPESLTAPEISSIPATIISLQDTMISAEIAANIESLAVDVGDKVEKGMELARLDCREFTIREEQALADLNSLKAKLPGIKARIAAAQSDVAANQSSVSLMDTQAKAAQASVAASKADAGRIKAQSQADQAKCHLANLDLQRARNLHKRQVISQQELDQAVSGFRAAQAECNAVQPELNSAYAKTQSIQASAMAAQVAIKVQQAKARMALSNIKVIEAEIPALNSQIAAANARLKTEALQVSRCRLLAPFSGEIIERAVQLGQRIGIGEKAFRILSSTEREVSASVSTTELKKLKQVKTLVFQTPDGKYPIKFRASVGVVRGEARTQEVRLTFSEPNKLPIGTSGRVVWGDNND